MPPTKTELHRTAMIKRLELEKVQADESLAQLETQRAQLQERKKELQAKLLRARSPFPPGEICPDCWLNSGKKQPLHPVPHEDPRHYDRWQCTICRYDYDRRIG